MRAGMRWRSYGQVEAIILTASTLSFGALALDDPALEAEGLAALALA